MMAERFYAALATAPKKNVASKKNAASKKKVALHHKEIAGEDENHPVASVTAKLRMSLPITYDDSQYAKESMRNSDTTSQGSSDSASQYVLQEQNLEVAHLKELHQLRMHQEKELHQRKLRQIQHEEDRITEIYNLLKKHMIELHNKEMKA